MDLLDCVSIGGTQYIKEFLTLENAGNYSTYLKECIKYSVIVEMQKEALDELTDILAERECFFYAAQLAI